jgi:hypothetical protein
MKYEEMYPEAALDEIDDLDELGLDEDILDEINNDDEEDCA